MRKIYKIEKLNCLVVLLCFAVSTMIGTKTYAQEDVFEGKYYSGQGDFEYLELLENAYRMIRPDPEIPNLSMFYHLNWNGFVEGPNWPMWWIQNSFGPTYTMLPFMDKAFQTFIANSQDLWFTQMGNGKRNDSNGYIAPPGCLADCAGLNRVYYRQGDGNHHIHDWVFGMTAAGMIMQSELLLVSRDMNAIKHYVPLLEKNAEFIYSRRDSVKNIFWAGTASNLLGPSFTGSGKLQKDGTYEMAYLAEISINYIAALNRLIELQKMLGRKEKVILYETRVALIEEGLKYFKADEGYFIRSVDKDGTKHGVFGAKKHGYFESTPNHDAMAFRIADDEQVKKIYDKIKSIPELRPNTFILANYPGYDELYANDGFFTWGTWVNGGAWATCEGRMQLGYYRAGAFNDAKSSFKRILEMAYSFKLDNPLKNFGADLWQPNEPINYVYDCWGVPGGFIRGLFEYEYTADGVNIYPHIPPTITQLNQKIPIYFGDKKIFISTRGKGEITSVFVNGKEIYDFKPNQIHLKMDSLQSPVFLSVGLGTELEEDILIHQTTLFEIPDNEEFWNVYNLYNEQKLKEKGEKVARRLKRIGTYYNLLHNEGMSNSFEYCFAQLILENVEAIYNRKQLTEARELAILPPESQEAADALYINTVENLYNGFVNHLMKDHSNASEQEKRAAKIWYEMR